MRVVVVRIGDISFFPPAISLTSALLDLGCDVTLIANGTKELPERLKNCQALQLVDLGHRGSAANRIMRIRHDPEIVRQYIDRHKSSIDCIWTTTDISARAVGDSAKSFPYVMQLSELVEYVPLFRMGASHLHSHKVIELARLASCVVVPEYNRAHIQQAWWDLPKTPIVLPNKPYPDNISTLEKLPDDIKSTLESDSRKKLLYQGLYTEDRNLEAYAKAIKILGDDYVLYIMGKSLGQGESWYERLSRITDNVVDLGFVPAPNHLAATPYGYIGLLPYKASKYSRNSVLNAVYCAPNKIWEYSRYGLPMIGSDVPGLTYAFHDGGMGITTKNDPEAIAEAVKTIDADYDTYSARSKAYYDSIDVKGIISKILREAVK